MDAPLLVSARDVHEPDTESLIVRVGATICVPYSTSMIATRRDPAGGVNEADVRLVVEVADAERATAGVDASRAIAIGYGPAVTCTEFKSAYVEIPRAAICAVVTVVVPSGTVNTFAVALTVPSVPSPR
jgi:hypothetical protein